MIEKVRRYIEQHHMIAEQDKIVIGVSGGADSVCLLFMLMEISRRYPFSLHVVHVNHGLRGADAQRDAAFVRDICQQYKLPFYLYEKDVNAYAKEHGLTLEEAGREVRYQAFEEIRTKIGAARIAVAHHKDDQAETVLFRLFRGSGIKGLGGIQPVRDDIIRPLLCLERQEIEQYIEKYGLSYCTDVTNANNHYTRNIIRNKVLPMIEAEVQERAVSHIADTAELMQDAEQYIYAQALLAFAATASTEAENGYRINVEKLFSYPPIIRQYIVRIAMERLADEWKDIGCRHVKDILELKSKRSGKCVMLPQGLTAKRDYEDILIFRTQIPKESRACRIQIDRIPQTVILPNGMKAEFSLEEPQKKQKIEQKTYTKQFDYDKIESGLLLRNRDKNDFFCINAAMDRQTIKTYCINEKIPRDKREELVLLADGAHILWVIGYRISEKYKITEETKKILKVHVYGGNANERENQGFTF